MSHSSAILEDVSVQPSRAETPAPVPAVTTASALSKAEPAEAEPEVGCPMCGNLEPWGNSSWCPQCGFYPRLGISLGPAVKPGTEAGPAPKSIREVWAKTPVWARILGAGVLAIFAGSVFARVTIPERSSTRSLVALLELATGLGALFTMHCAAFLKAAMSNHRFGIVDCLLHPIETWQPTIQELPRSARRIWLGAWGLTATICALVVVGGIRYSALLDDWGFRNRIKSEVVSRVKAESERLVGGGALAGNLEQKVQERAEVEAKEAAIRAENGSELEMQTTDCVVIGYNVSAGEDAISELLLASLVDGELKYVGSVTEGIPEHVQKELLRRLPELKRDTAFIKCTGSGIWVKPVVACKTSFRTWTDDKMLNETKFQELMAEIGGVK